MADAAYESEDISLQDGTEVTLRPLPIKDLRKFMRVWGDFVKEVQDNANKPEEEQFSDVEAGDKQFETFIDLAEICLKKVRGDRNDEKYREWIEETLDEQSLYRIFEKCGGLTLNNPNLQSPGLMDLDGKN